MDTALLALDVTTMVDIPSMLWERGPLMLMLMPTMVDITMDTAPSLPPMDPSNTTHLERDLPMLRLMLSMLPMDMPLPTLKAMATISTTILPTDTVPMVTIIRS